MLGFYMHCRHTGRLAVHGEAGDKASLYRDRYQVLLQRLSRDKYFSKPAFDTVATEHCSCEVFLPAMCYLSITY
jgi:DNA polymerase epsilon subunit 2